MLWNIIWLSFTGIRRKKPDSILYFIMAFFISQSLFLVRLSSIFIQLPENETMNNFFFIIIYSVIILCIVLLTVVTVLFTHIHGAEYCVLRIYGVRRSDIIFISSLEIFALSCVGALTGTFCIILMIKTKVLYLPYFFESMRKLELIKIIGIGGQAVSGVIIIMLIITVIVVSLRLRKDIPQLLRGSF